MNAALEEKLAAAGIPAAQIKQMDQVVAHPQLTERDRWRTVGTEHATARALLPPSTFDDFEAPMGDVPALGQHTRALLIEAGHDPDALLREGIAVHNPVFDDISREDDSCLQDEQQSSPAGRRG
ncbi:CoA transferase [Rhodococcoides kyotonense]|uniref:CoA-transferase family III n=1 Tax=Rhodococcoides kyotonense TaxID=398843 RepID=A0A239NDB0_9NOCA|nr:CoA-transferase family III [Rhodococcus kyotonensis]